MSLSVISAGEANVVVLYQEDHIDYKEDQLAQKGSEGLGISTSILLNSSLKLI